VFAIQHRFDDGGEVIAWSNWQVPKDRGLYVMLTIWTALWIPAGVAVTIATACDSIAVSVVFMPIFWGGLLLALSAFLRLAAREAIRITDDCLEVRVEGVLRKGTVTYPRTAVVGLSLERYDDESVQTLNLWSQGVHRLSGRTLLAYSLSNGAKAEVYKLLQAGFQRRGWTVNDRSVTAI